MNAQTTYKAIAEALPWEIQSGLLSIRDDNLTMKDIPWKFPVMIYVKMFELQLIEVDNATGTINLSRLGNHLVDFCTC